MNENKAPEYWVIYRGYGMDRSVVGIVATEEDAKVLEAVATCDAAGSDREISYDGPFPLGAVQRGAWERVSGPDANGLYQTVEVSITEATVKDGVVTVMAGESLL